MDDFERRLGMALKDAAPAPPTEMPAAGIIELDRPRPRRHVTPVLSGFVVTAVAVLVVWLVSNTGTHGNRSVPVAPPPVMHTTYASVQPRPTPSVPLFGPAALADTWTLVGLDGLNGAAHTAPDSYVSFVIHPDGAISQGCVTATARLTGTKIIFTQPFISNLLTNCPSLPVDQDNFLLETVLTGAPHWHITGDNLTIEQHGGAGAEFRRGYLQPGDADLCPPTGDSQTALPLTLSPSRTFTNICLYAPAEIPLTLSLNAQTSEPASDIFVSHQDKPACEHATGTPDSMIGCSSNRAIFSSSQLGAGSLNIGPLDAGNYVIQMSTEPAAIAFLTVR